MDRLLRSYLGELTTNETHQVVVTCSKHLHILKSGVLAYQKKLMAVTLKNIRASTRRHVVHYVLTDTASGSIYGEIHASDGLVPVQDFLARAWAKKTGTHFCGVPQRLDVPATIYSENLHRAALRLGVRTLGKPLNGFASGIRSVKTWENMVMNIAFPFSRPPRTFDIIENLSPILSHGINLQNMSRELWENNLTDLVLPPSDLVNWGDLIHACHTNPNLTEEQRVELPWSPATAITKLDCLWKLPALGVSHEDVINVVQRAKEIKAGCEREVPLNADLNIRVFVWKDVAGCPLWHIEFNGPADKIRIIRETFAGPRIRIT